MKSAFFSFITVLALAGGALRGQAQTPTQSVEFARYQVIIDRSPFGTVAAEGAAAGAAPASFTLKYQLVGLVNSNCPEQTLLAIVFDKEANRSYFKAEGEMLDDVKIVKIERTPPKLTLQHGLETSSLTFAERSNQPTPGMPGVPPQPGMQIPPGFPQPGAVPTAPPGIRRIPFRRGT